MTPTPPVTYDGQVTAANVLTGLLLRAAAETLPALGWSISATEPWRVTGRCYGLSQRRRSDVDTWRAALGAGARPDVVDEGGAVTYLCTEPTYIDGIRVTVVADVFTDATEPFTLSGLFPQR